MSKKLNFLILIAAFVLNACQSPNINSQTDSSPEIDKLSAQKFSEFSTDLSKNSIPFDQILSGGPGKDGIPAIDNPKFTTAQESDLNDSDLGIFLEINGDQRFYPLSILVWHEIVNDNVGGKPVAVTFCPLCGTSIVFSRIVNQEELDFGVSGFLYESNLLMYDSQTESFWSQTLGEALVGSYTGTKLELESMQQLSFKEVKSSFPSAQILSTDTGYSRNYSRGPYGSYNENEDLYFPVSIQDESYPAKKIFLIVPVEDTWAAFPWTELIESGSANLTINSKTLSVKLTDSQTEILYDGVEMPSYFEMWFSFAIHHQEDSMIWQP